MNELPKSLQIKKWYKTLPAVKQQELRKDFIEKFNLSVPTFYGHLRSDDLPFSIVIFFAEWFQVEPERLYDDPFNTDSKKKQTRTHSIDRVAERAYVAQQIDLVK